jgi:hypothetical protein
MLPVGKVKGEQVTPVHGKTETDTVIVWQRVKLWFMFRRMV